MIGIPKLGQNSLVRLQVVPRRQGWRGNVLIIGAGTQCGSTTRDQTN